MDVPFETVDAVTTAVTASVTRKSGNICQLEHLSNGSAVLTREHNPTSSNRKMTSPRSGALVKRPKIVSGELVDTSERKGTEREGRSEYEFDTGEQDDVFEPHDPKKDSNLPLKDKFSDEKKNQYILLRHFNLMRQMKINCIFKNG